MSFLDKFLNAVRLNDDYDDDDEFFDEEDETEEFDDEPIDVKEPEEEPEEKTRNRFFHKIEQQEEEEPVRKAQKPEQKPSRFRSSSAKVTPMRKQSAARNDMEVSVIRPTTMENTRDIADTLLANCTVILNLEGIDVELAQRIIDFACGTCYAIEGSLQKVSSNIFILTPASVEISGDIQDVLTGGIPSIRSDF